MRRRERVQQAGRYNPVYPRLRRNSTIGPEGGHKLDLTARLLRAALYTSVRPNGPQRSLPLSPASAPTSLHQNGKLTASKTRLYAALGGWTRASKCLYYA